MTNQEALREFVLIASENGCHRDKWSIKRKGTNDIYHPGPLYYETAKQACDIDDSLYCEPVSVDTCIVWSKRYWKAAAGFALQGSEKMPSRKDYMIKMVESDNEREVVKLFVSNKRDIKDLIHF